VKKAVEKKDQDKRTALWWAACNGHTAVVHLLREYGANALIKDADKRTPGSHTPPLPKVRLYRSTVCLGRSPLADVAHV
jgi:ankyrin repeat protein